MNKKRNLLDDNMHLDDNMQDDNMQADEGVESEPEDENPERETEDVVGAELPLDSSDEEDESDELITFEDAFLRPRDACGSTTISCTARVQEFGLQGVEGSHHPLQLDCARLVAGHNSAAELRQEQDGEGQWGEVGSQLYHSVSRWGGSTLSDLRQVWQGSTA